MQSSLWKLLTAAGIIGIGTLVVLEVQNRLPMPRSSTDTAAGQVIGTETSVTPDAATDLDRLLASADDPVAAELFDHPATGAGTPAPPADDSTFYGAIDRTVRKDNLSDSGSPFAMEEPAFAIDEPAEKTTGSATSTGGTGSRNAIRPASFEPDRPDSPNPASGTSTAALDDDPVIPFPSEDPPETSGSVAAPKPAASSAAVPAGPNSSRKETNELSFFPIGGDAGTSSVPAATQPNPAGSTTTFAPSTAARTPASANPPAANPARTARTVERTSATTAADEPPDIFFPEPVPDITVPEKQPAAGSDDVPSFDSSPFGEDPVPFGEDPAPVSNNPEPRSNPRPDPVDEPRSEPRPEFPTTTPAPKDEGNPPFFEPDSPAATPPSRPETDVRDSDEAGDDTESLPFMEDEPAVPASGTGVPQPRPASDFPSPDTDFPEPRSPGSTPGPKRDPLNSDLPEPFGGPGDSLPDRTEPLPLPSADEPPVRPGRTDRNFPPRTNDGTDRNVSEVMRPQLTIRKQAPETATVGVSHDYTIVVTNEGDSTAYDVVVEDELGGAAEYVDAVPDAEYNRASGELMWNFAELPPGKKKEITVRIRPTGEGTLDGIATVRFKAQVKSATVITAPKLELDITGTDAVKVGEEVPLLFTIRNNGSGDARNVILRSVLPPGLKHPEGGDLEYEIENLPAGEQQEVELTVVAAEPGDRILVAAEVTTAGISAAKARMEIEIVGAQLSLERHGPERRYVGRSAMYQNIVVNNSQFEATNAIVQEEVPEGMRFVSAGNGGTYNPDNRRIRWNIARLAPGKQAVLDVELMAETAGRMETIVEVTEAAGFRTPLTENTIVTVEDLHNLTADISRQDEPVAIGERFGFTVTIDNRGTAVARNVEMSVLVPPEIRVLAAGTRQVPGKLHPGNVVRYNMVQEIQPDASMTFQLTLQGEKPIRNAAVQASLKYDEMPEPLIVSESVTVFDDRP